MDDLLDIARVTSGKIVLSRHPIDLSAAVERCLGMLANTGRLGRHTWHTALQAAWVDADETRVEQIVTNLLSNAVKFTADGGDIAVRVSTQGAETVLVVEDSGVGISPALLPRIFELFVQGERSLDRTQGGLGLGLTLVRRLTEMHGGTVTAMSDGPGRGATFTVRLPNVPAPSEPDRRPAEVAAGAPLCILVVEDNPDGREMLRAMLEQDGHVVHEAADGPSAMDRALELHPDVAIVDIGLPEIDGYGVALRIRAAERGGTGTCLIALSGYGTEEDRRRTAQAGFDAHLTKPVEPDKLRLILTTRRRRGAHDDGDC
jgi:CheY-like chemotaxis protein/anti-sigma regulatory factor (Ser/Thr protein kinase)